MPVLDVQNDTRDYKVAEAYLKTLVDTEHPFATILMDAQPVYIGKDLPGEYKGSEYTHGLNRSTRQVKMQAATNLDEMLLLAENGEWRENVKDKHKKDAKNGWYRYSTQFALPVLDIKKAVDHYTVYSGTLLIRNDADGKSYLYDLLDIKKEKVISSPSFSARERSEVFEPKPSREQYMQNPQKSQQENTDKDQRALRDVALSDREVLRRAADLALNDRKLNFTQADRERLKIFKKRLDILDEKQTQRQGYLQTKRDILSEREAKELSAEERAELRKTQNRLDVVNEQIRRANGDIDQLMGVAPEAMRKLLKKSRAVVERDTMRYGMERLDAYRNQRNNTEARNKYKKRLTNTALTMSDWLQKNSDKEHVPETLKKPLTELLTMLDFSSERLLSGGAATKADQRIGGKLAKLNQLLQNQVQAAEGSESSVDELGMYLDISGENREFLMEIASRAGQESEAGKLTVNRMTTEELRSLTHLMENLATAIRKANRTYATARYAHISDMSEKSITHFDMMGEISYLQGTRAADFLQWKNAVPYYAFRRFGAPGMALFEGFMKGQEKLAFRAKEIIDFTESVYKSEDARKWRREVKTISLANGQKVRMTVAQMMGLTMLAKRGEAAMRHINGVGVIIGEIKGDKGAKQTTPFRMTEEDLRRIASMLTPEQTRVAKALQKFMAERGAEWGNEISLARFGYKFYTEGEHYYPIRTAESSRNMSDKDPSNSMFRLLNLSASKSLNPKANNALVVEDIFDVFSEHTADMARLNAYGLPLLDAIKWFNYRQLLPGDNGTLNERNLKASMDTAFGKAAGQYFRQLIRDINGVREGGDRGVGAFSKALISNYKVAAVGANLRVAVLQPTSYLRARHVLDEKYLAAALQFHKYSGKKAYQEALQYSGTAVWKSLGYYDTDISRGLGKQIIQDETLMDKVKEKSMFLVEKGDKVTWARLWIAAKLQTKAQHPELAGEELCRATADLFREVIYGTQVMDCTLTRSTIMRGNNIYDKTISAFGAEPTLSYNILMDAATQYEIDRRKYGKREALRRNKALIGQAIVTYLVSSVGSAVVESIFDAIRDDDDYETFLQKFWQAFMGENGFFSGNLGQDLSIVGKIPAVKDIISALQGDTGNSLSTAAASSISQVYAIWKETIQLQNGDLASPTKTTYYGNMTTWGKIYKTTRAFSQVSGMAVSNALRDVNALVNTFGGDWKFYDPGEKSSIKRAYTDGLISEEEATGYLRELAEDTKEQEKLMREFARWKCEVEEGFPYDTIKPKFKKGKLTRQEAMRLLQEYGSKTEKQANKALDDWQAEQDEEDA